MLLLRFVNTAIEISWPQQPTRLARITFFPKIRRSAATTEFTRGKQFKTRSKINYSLVRIFMIVWTEKNVNETFSHNVAEAECEKSINREFDHFDDAPAGRPLNNPSRATKTPRPRPTRPAFSTRTRTRTTAQSGKPQRPIPNPVLDAIRVFLQALRPIKTTTSVTTSEMI